MLMELLAIFLWALGNIFVAYLNMFFDNYTQNFFRFVSAAMVLLFFSMLLNKDDYLGSLKNLKMLSTPVFTVFAFQILVVYGIAFTTPTIDTLITRLSIVFVDLLSFLLFPEEKAVLSKKGFATGTMISFIGVSGVVLTGSGLFHSNGLFLARASSSYCWPQYSGRFTRFPSRLFLGVQTRFQQQSTSSCFRNNVPAPLNINRGDIQGFKSRAYSEPAARRLRHPCSRLSEFSQLFRHPEAGRIPACKPSDPPSGFHRRDVGCSVP